MLSLEILLRLATSVFSGGCIIFHVVSAQAAHTLFDPVPREELRELSTDRPDTTESPHSVDAGHVQAETEPLTYTRDSENGVETRQLDFAGMNLKVGLSDFADLQLGLQPYSRLTVTSNVSGTTSEQRQHGFGDLELRLKLNIFGNGEEIALAAMPFVHLPTGAEALSTGGTEFGLIAPFGFGLPGEFGCAVMAEIDAVRGHDGDLEGELLLTATTSHDILGPVAAFAEVVALTPLLGGGPQWGVDVGSTVAIDDFMLIDGGARLGISAELPDLALFLGWSKKL